MTAPQRPSPSSGPGAQRDADPESFRIPRLQVDPLASIRAVPIEVDAFGQTWTIPAMNARQWFELLWAENFSITDVFPGLVGAESEMLDAIFAGETTLKEVVDIAFEVIAEATGYEYWVAFRLVTVIREAWMQTGGKLTQIGVDPERITLGAYLTAALAFYAENMEPKKTVELFDALRQPPPDEEEAIKRNEIQDGEAFLAAMSQSL